MNFVKIFKLLLLGLHLFLIVTLIYHTIVKYNKLCPIRAPYHICVANLHCRYNDDFRIVYEGREFYNHCGHRDYVQSTAPLNKYRIRRCLVPLNDQNFI